MKALEELKRYFVDGTAVLILVILPIFLIASFIWTTWPSVFYILALIFVLAVAAVVIGVFIDLMRDL